MSKKKQLTETQLKVIKAIKEHKGSRVKAAEALGMNKNTVHAHCFTVYKMFKVNSFFELLYKLDMLED